ncbi:hypothetical protein [Streptomyces sp. NPDC005907]|uniref:hypothetical protein n=1 Tax=Streptomyces sp. NPDC005907 TaxID=3154571 RepID=UPI0033EA23CE
MSRLRVQTRNTPVGPVIELAGVFGMTLTAVPDRVGRTFRVIGLDQDVTTHATARAAELARRMPAD